MNNIELIPLEQVARMLKLNVQTLRRAVATEELQAYKIGRGYQTTQEWLNEWLAKQKVQAGRQ
jgi:excisionase family DNA binding protein